MLRLYFRAMRNRTITDYADAPAYENAWHRAARRKIGTVFWENEIIAAIWKSTPQLRDCIGKIGVAENHPKLMSYSVIVPSFM